MAQNFLTCDREQSFLLPPDLRDWLPEDHLAWFVIDTVGVMDLSGFYAGYREDGLGRAAYEPSMMVALILYCWSRGMRSSRRIERACVEDVACRVISANQRPDHATIARFIERHQGALGDLFGEVLWLCADAGLATVSVVAIDGTKVAANANRDRTMSYEQIARRSSRRRSPQTPRRMLRLVIAAGMSCRRSSLPVRVASAGCAQPASA
jgi:transposase